MWVCYACWLVYVGVRCLLTGICGRVMLVDWYMWVCDAWHVGVQCLLTGICGCAMLVDWYMWVCYACWLVYVDVWCLLTGICGCEMLVDWYMWVCDACWLVCLLIASTALVLNVTWLRGWMVHQVHLVLWMRFVQQYFSLFRLLL